MAYHLTAATPADRTLVVEALRAVADQRTRAATKASAVLFTPDGPRDPRAASVRVARMLGEAATLARMADDLEAAPDVDEEAAELTRLRAELTGDAADVERAYGPAPSTPPQDRDPDDEAERALDLALAYADDDAPAVEVNVIGSTTPDEVTAALTRTAEHVTRHLGETT